MARRHSRPAPLVEEQPWWVPKRYGYGAGLPIAWQGWAASLAYALLVTGAAIGLLPHSALAFLAITSAATAALIVVAARKTRGGWHWRWRKDNNQWIDVGSFIPIYLVTPNYFEQKVNLPRIHVEAMIVSPKQRESRYGSHQRNRRRRHAQRHQFSRSNLRLWRKRHSLR